MYKIYFLNFNFSRTRFLYLYFHRLSELNHSLKDIKVEPSERVHVDPEVYGEEYDNYFLAKSYFDVREYDR